MSTEPVTLMVARRVRDGRYHDLLAWLHEGEQLAADFPGYLGSGVLAPPPGDDEFQIVFRFADEQTLDTSEHRARGIDAWFGGTDSPPPPRWKQSVAIWLAFFPVSLLFNALFGNLLGELSLVARILLSTLALTPLMTYLFIPLSTRLLASWLHAPRRPQTQPLSAR